MPRLVIRAEGPVLRPKRVNNEHPAMTIELLLAGPRCGLGRAARDVGPNSVGVVGHCEDAIVRPKRKPGRLPRRNVGPCNYQSAYGMTCASHMGCCVVCDKV